MNILELQNLKKYFATQKAVDDISFNIAQGDIFGLLGPNGAGKTTLLRMITGIFYPDSGEVVFNGRKFDPINDTAYIGYMPEERGLYKKMKIGEQAVYLAQLKGLSKADAMSKIKAWFVKLQFVTTVLHEPKLIILDEPFSGLDPVNANLIKDEIFSLAQKGSTIIFSTHRMEQVEEICNHIVLVNKGKKILDGTVKEVKNEFKENMYRIGAAILPEDIQHPAFEVIKHKPDELLLKLAPGTKTNDVLQYFISKNITVNTFSEVFPSLNYLSSW